MTLTRSYAQSQRLFDRMARVLPAGSTRTTTYYAPFPIAIARGEGYRVWDVDGNEYLDLMSNYTALVHGHAHPAIVEAADRAMRGGSAFPAPLEIHADLAERICLRVPSITKVRFTNSGNEAVITAVRAARALTGRDHLVKAIGGYHGSWEQVLLASSEDDTESDEVQTLPGVPSVIARMLHAVRYNDIAHLEATMAKHGSRVAAILLEPVLGHVNVAGEARYLERAQELAAEHGALFILDEVITLRLDEGGVQRTLDLSPDLTTLGKVIGGGLPVGAIGGSDEAMSIFDPRRSDHISHHGTFNGNTPTMAAGCASLDLLPQAEIERINELGERLAVRLSASLESAGLGLTVTGVGSMMNLRGDVDLLAAVHAEALDAGLYLAPRGLVCISTPMDDGVVTEIAERLDGVFRAVADSA